MKYAVTVTATTSHVAMDAPDADADAPLPPSAELSPQLVAILDAHFASPGDLPGAADLSSELGRRCADLDGDLAALRGRIARLAVSWIYRSLGAKSLIQKSLVKLENLSVRTSQCWFSAHFSFCDFFFGSGFHRLRFAFRRLRGKHFCVRVLKCVIVAGSPLARCFD